ncbi:MAG: class I SAM-dependent methyltransferase [Rickettsiales bacterium]|nr:class I SAM-dependent methyltransferase [Rickettsiales bacterium]
MSLFFIICIVLLFALFCWLALYITILFFDSKAFRRSPTVTSSSKSIKVMTQYIRKYNEDVLKKTDLKILDIGSGYGRLLFKMNKLLNNPNNIFVGYEISKLSYKISVFLNKYKNVYLINNDIKNLYDDDFDFVISFMLKKQQKELINVYKKFKKGTIIVVNSNAIPFGENDGYKKIDTLRVGFGWDVFIYIKN